MANKLGLASVASLCVLAVSSAHAQTYTTLQNGGFEVVDTLASNLPQGWNPFNGAIRRTVGDGLLPPVTSAQEGTAVVDLTPPSVGNSEFIGFSSNDLFDPLDPVSPKNNVGYIFNPPSGEDLALSGWFMIPASDPMVKHRAGLKIEFRRTVNDSVYEGFDFFCLDPENLAASLPGSVIVNTPGGPGLHTNGQWLRYSAVFHQTQFALNGSGQPNWPLPPQNPNAKASLLAFRFGPGFADGARGTVFVDNVTLERVAPCRADFNASGAVTVQDIFDFLAAYFSSAPTADINNSGSVTVQDIFDFLALYFAGCP